MTAIVDKVKLSIYRYATYEHVFNVWADEAKTIAASIAGYTAKLEFRDKVDGAVLFTATNGNGLLTVSNNGVALKIPYATVGAWSFTAAQYDLFVISPTNEATAIAKGTAIVTNSITHLP